MASGLPNDIYTVESHSAEIRYSTDGVRLDLLRTELATGCSLQDTAYR